MANSIVSLDPLAIDTCALGSKCKKSARAHDMHSALRYDFQTQMKSAVRNSKKQALSTALASTAPGCSNYLPEDIFEDNLWRQPEVINRRILN